VLLTEINIPATAETGLPLTVLLKNGAFWLNVVVARAADGRAELRD